MKLHPFLYLLIWLSTADPKMVKQGGVACVKKYSIIGLSSLIPTALAFFSGWLFCQSFIDDVNPAWFGGGIAALIFLLDRIILAFLVQNGNTFNLGVVLRIIIALILAWVLSIPVEVGFFKDIIEKDQNDHLQTSVKALKEFRDEESEKVQERYHIWKERIEARISHHQGALKEQLTIVNKLQKSFLEEIDGKAKSLTEGYGPIAREKETKYYEAKRAYEEMKRTVEEEIRKLNSQLTDTYNDYKDDLADLKDEFVSDKITYQSNLDDIKILGQYKKLNELASDDASLGFLVWVFRLLFFLLDLSPLVLKLLWKDDEYDHINQNEQDICGYRNELHYKLEREKAFQESQLDTERQQFQLQLTKQKNKSDQLLQSFSQEADAQLLLAAMYLAKVKKAQKFKKEFFYNNLRAELKKAFVNI